MLNSNSLLWALIRASKLSRNEYVSPEVQYVRLHHLLGELDSRTRNSIHREWDVTLDELRDSPAYPLLHELRGGIVGGWDTFYMDFGSWVIGQGEQLVLAILVDHNPKAVLDYIEKHGVPYDEYTYECLSYVFQEFDRVSFA